MYAKWQGVFFLFWRILASMTGKVSSAVTVFWCGHLSLRLRPSALFSHIQEGRYIPFSLVKGYNLDAETLQRKHEHQIGSEIQHSHFMESFLFHGQCDVASKCTGKVISYVISLWVWTSAEGSVEEGIWSKSFCSEWKKEEGTHWGAADVLLQI